MSSLSSKINRNLFTNFMNFLHNNSMKLPYTKENIKVKILNNKIITKDALVFDVKFQDNNSNSVVNSIDTSKNNEEVKFFIPPSLHFSLLSDIKIGKTVLSKRYTPVYYTQPDTCRCLFRIYKNENEETIGRIGKYLINHIDSEISLEYSYGKILYFNDGVYKIKNEEGNKIITDITEWKEEKVKQVCLIAAGTGISPILRLLKQAEENEDKSEFYLIYCNSTFKQLYFLEELEQIKKNLNLKIKYIVKRESKDEIISANNTEYLKKLGFESLVIEHEFTPSTISGFFPKANDETIVFNCGSKIMMNGFLKPMLNSLNYKFINF